MPFSPREKGGDEGDFFVIDKVIFNSEAAGFGTYRI